MQDFVVHVTFCFKLFLMVQRYKKVLILPNSLKEKLNKIKKKGDEKFHHPS
jgi:hypothetical protein